MGQWLNIVLFSLVCPQGMSTVSLPPVSVSVRFTYVLQDWVNSPWPQGPPGMTDREKNVNRKRFYAIWKVYYSYNFGVNSNTPIMFHFTPLLFGILHDSSQHYGGRKLSSAQGKPMTNS